MSDEHVRVGGRGQPSDDDTGTSARRAPLAVALSELAHRLQQQHDLQSTFDTVLSAVVDAVPGAQHATICHVRARHGVETQASTGELPMAVDQAQYETGEGPCLDSLYQQHTVRIRDLGTETRWPRFSSRAAALGVRSMLSVQLFVQEEDLGALNISSTEVGAFTDESEHVALLIASHASVAIDGAQRERQLRSAMDTRDVIGKAIGILMERHGLTAETAFDALTRLSQHRNRKLSEIAATLVSTHEIPGFLEPGARVES